MLGSSVAAGIGHSIISNANREAVRATISSSSVNNPNVNKFLNSDISPMQELFSDGEVMYYICLSLCYLLFIQLIFKLYFKEKIDLKLSKLLGVNNNIKIEFYLNKIIILNKKMSIVWLLLALTTIVLALSVQSYALYKIFINIDSFVQGHISFNTKIINYTTGKSLILNLNVINTLCVITSISLFV